MTHLSSGSRSKYSLEVAFLEVISVCVIFQTLHAFFRSAEG